MKKELKEFTKEELCKVFNTNNKLQEKIRIKYMREKMLEIYKFFDIIEPTLEKFNIDFYSKNYLEFFNEEEFLTAVLEAQKQHHMLSKEHNIEDILDKYDEWTATPTNDPNYDDLVEVIQKETHKLKSDLLETIDKLTALPSLDCLCERFLNNVSQGLYSKEYMVDTDTYIMYRTYTESYKER